MKCLITGGAGFIGSFVAEELLNSGYEVILFDNLTPQVHQNRERPEYLDKRARLVVGDVRDAKALSCVLKESDYVIHLASAVGVAQSNYEISNYCDVNVNGTAVLCEELIKEKDHIRKVVVAGSMTEYGEGLYVKKSDGSLIRPSIRTNEGIQAYGWEPCDPITKEPLENVPIDENASLDGKSVYALTKRMQEDLILNMDFLYNIPAVSLRFFNVYGERQSLNNPYTGVLAIFISQILNGNPPQVYEDGKQTRDFIYVRDVAKAIKAALFTQSHGVKINIGSGTGTQIGELAHKLCALLKPEFKPNITGKFRKGDIRHCTANIELAEKVLNFKPETPLNAGIANLIKWAHQQKPQDRTLAAAAELAAKGLL